MSLPNIGLQPTAAGGIMRPLRLKPQRYADYDYWRSLTSVKDRGEHYWRRLETLSAGRANNEEGGCYVPAMSRIRESLIEWKLKRPSA